MPKPCQLKQIDGAMWARLDMDWDGGPVSLYTEAEIEIIKLRERREIINIINNIDRISLRDE